MTEHEPRRLFLALDLDAASVDRFAALGERLRASHLAPRASFTPPEKIHLTLRFFGDVEAARVPELMEAMRPVVDGYRALSLEARSLEAFPSRAHANVIVVAMREPTGELTRLVEAIEQRAEVIGIPREQRPFRPHVTLARPKAPTDARRWLKSVGRPDVGTCVAARIALYWSRLRPEGGTEYTALMSGG